MTEVKEKYYTIDSDKLVTTLIENGNIEKIGVGDRYSDEFPGLFNDHLKADNTYNWEILDDDDDEKRFYSLSNDFEIRESDKLLILSKHIGVDIRGGYEDEQIFIKTNNDESFYSMIWDIKDDLAIEDK